MKFDESVKFERLKLLELHLRTLTRRVIETLASVKASHDGWGRIPVAEGRTVSNVNPNLIRCSVIAGRGIDVDTGEPIANQHISFYDAARLESQAANHGAKTDETGTYDRYAVGWGRPIVLINTAGNITGSVRDHDLEKMIQTLIAD